ncbi:MAG TPA: hypothetical protein VD859_01290, partial [Nocardioides sp.]|nr:hypothetical protein [Nocardioides sp.]
MSSITHGASSPDGDEGGGARRGRGWRRGRDRDPDPTAETPEDVVGLDEDEVESLILRSIAAGREDAVDGDVDAAPAADEDIASKVSARSRQDHEPALTVGNTRPSPPAASEASSDEDVEIDWSAVVSPVERPRSVEPEEDVEAVASEAEPETAPLGGTYDEPMDVRAELLGTRDPIAAAEPAASVDAPVGEASRDDEAARRVIAQALEAGFSEPVPTEPKRRLFGRRRNRKDDPDEDDELLADEELAAGDETGADEVPETEAAGGPTDVEA